MSIFARLKPVGFINGFQGVRPVCSGFCCCWVQVMVSGSSSGGGVYSITRRGRFEGLSDKPELVPGYSSVLALCESLKSPSEISLSPAYSLETASRSASVAFKAMLLVLESVERDTIVSAVACSVKLSLTNRPLTITNWPPVLGLSAGSYTTFWATSRKVHFLKFSLLKPAGSWLKSN